jgi:tRNA pseudouridine55 synthase
MTNKYQSPLIFNVFKPARLSSYDVVRHYKRNLPKGYGKIGHFGTLDPFASGVLMIGVNGAAKLNDFIHEMLPKTYLAIGKLGVETETGDLTIEPSQIDDSDYLKNEISQFSIPFIQDFIEKRFLGEYMQAPHKYSAAKFEGKALHKWAREGVEIKKEPKKRIIHKIEVVKYNFPYLCIRFEVSSGTYIRTLFSDCANSLGTIGTLVSLVREKVGGCTDKNYIKKSNWPNGEDWDLNQFGQKVDEVLKLGSIIFAEKEAMLYSNGVVLKSDRAQSIEDNDISKEYYWVRNTDQEILGLAQIIDGVVKVKFNLST